MNPMQAFRWVLAVISFVLLIVPASPAPADSQAASTGEEAAADLPFQDKPDTVSYQYAELRSRSGETAAILVLFDFNQEQMRFSLFLRSPQNTGLSGHTTMEVLEGGRLRSGSRFEDGSGYWLAISEEYALGIENLGQLSPERLDAGLAEGIEQTKEVRTAESRFTHRTFEPPSDDPTSETHSYHPLMVQTFAAGEPSAEMKQGISFLLRVICRKAPDLSENFCGVGQAVGYTLYKQGTLPEQTPSQWRVIERRTRDGRPPADSPEGHFLVSFEGAPPPGPARNPAPAAEPEPTPPEEEGSGSLR